MIQKFILALVLCLIADPLWAFPTVSLRDNCTRANEGPPPSASWTTIAVFGYKIVSNVCVPNDVATFNGSVWNTSFGPNMEVAITLNTKHDDGVYGYLLLRLQTNNDYNADHYEVDLVPVAGANNDTIEVWKEVSTSLTQLGSTISLGADFAPGDVVGARIVGNVIEVFRNGASLGTHTDGASSVTGAGYAGIQADPVVTNSLTFTAFYAGTYVSGSDSFFNRRRAQ